MDILFSTFYSPGAQNFRAKESKNNSVAQEILTIDSWWGPNALFISSYFIIIPVLFFNNNYSLE